MHSPTRALTGLLLWLGIAAPAAAGYFNCAVIYDEFESLMNGQFLVEPDQFATTLHDRITRNQFENLQKGQFRLYTERSDAGIAVFRTNQNLHGKMLFRWQDAPDQTAHVIIVEAVVFARVADGYGPSVAGPLRVKPGTGVDLDTMSYVSMERDGQRDGDQSVPHTSASADLYYGLGADSGEPTLAAANGALVYFPVETLCLEAQRR